MNQVTPVILCGGAGTRLWPLSRSGFPKQLFCLTGNESLFQQAARQLMGLGSTDIQVDNPIVVCNGEHRFLALEQLRETGIGLSPSLLEPDGRNTTPALTLAAIEEWLRSDPSSHSSRSDINRQRGLNHCLQSAIRDSLNWSIIILGIAPTSTEADCGYAQVGLSDTKRCVQGEVPFKIICFVEEPIALTAQQCIDQGGYFWNAGTFVLKSSVWLNALQKLRPDIFKVTLTAWEQRLIDGPFFRPGKEAFLSVPSESIGYAVMGSCPASNN